MSDFIRHKKARCDAYVKYLALKIFCIHTEEKNCAVTQK